MIIMITTKIQRVNLQELEALTCPLCGSTLASDKYNQAITELKKKTDQVYQTGLRNQKTDYENKIKEIIKLHKEQEDGLNEFYTNQCESLKTEINNANRFQLTELKKNYENQILSYKEQIEKSNIEAEQRFKKEIDMQKSLLDQLKNKQQEIKVLAIEEGKMLAMQDIQTLRSEISQKNIQLERLQVDLEKLKTQASQKQSELKGEAGERDLFAVLANAFPDDELERQKRGSSSGDIIQRIKYNNQILKTPIIFDNKEAQSVTKLDIEKAKRYKSIHNTNYVIIVSENLPKKECGLSLIGEKEGVLMANPVVIVELTRQIRKFLMDLSKERMSQKNRQDKEAQLFELITSEAFVRKLNCLYEIYNKEKDIQVKEEKDHQNLWKNRRALVEQLRDIYVEICGGIDSIIQNNPT